MNASIPEPKDRPERDVDQAVDENRKPTDPHMDDGGTDDDPDEES